MPDPIAPLRFLLLLFAGLVNRKQARSIAFQREECRVLKEQSAAGCVSPMANWRASTIAKTLQDHGVPPSTERPTNWRTFLKALAGVIAAMDFFTVEVWTARGLVTHYVLFVLHHTSRLVEIAGVNTNPDGAFMAQVARNLPTKTSGAHLAQVHDALFCLGKYDLSASAVHDQVH